MAKTNGTYICVRFFYNINHARMPKLQDIDGSLAFSDDTTLWDLEARNGLI